MKTGARAALVVLFGLAAAPLSAQLAVGQYRDEAPVRTWNDFPFLTAPALGRGGTALAAADGPVSALANPALLIRLPGWTVSASYGSQSAEMFRFGPVNTGVFMTDDPVALNRSGPESLAASYQWKGWALALAAAEIETYARPEIRYESVSRGTVWYRETFEQSGFLRTAVLSLARRLGSRWAAGLGVGLVWGRIDRSLVDEDFSSGLTFSSRASGTLSAPVFQAGLTWDPSETLSVAAVARGPFRLRSENASAFRFQAPGRPTDILIEAQAEDSTLRPWAFGVGAAWSVLPRWTIAADLVYQAWSNYETELFGEIQEIDFRDTVRIGLGAEYRLKIRWLGFEWTSPLRFGISYDPQPMRDPASSYILFTAGTGIRWRGLQFDSGFSFGRESGSGRKLDVRRFSAGLTVWL